MALEEIRIAFLDLHRDVTELLGDVLRARFQWRFILRGTGLNAFEARLDPLFRRFAELDAQLTLHTKPPADLNTALRASAHFALYSAVRESARGLLSDTNTALGSLRNQVDFHRSLALSLVSLVVAIIALFV